MWNAQLIAAGRYRLWTIRARYDTKRQTHPEDSEVWVAMREDLAMRLDVLDPPDKTFKFQPFLLQSEFELAEVDPVSITLQKRAYRPLAPLNLRAQDDGYCPTYSAGQDTALTWDQSSPRRAVREPERDCPSHADHVIAKVWDTSAGANRGERTFDCDS